MRGISVIFLLLVLLSDYVFALSRDEIAALCASFFNSTVKIGMVTRGSTQLILDRWTPTFETYLTASLSEYGCQTQLVPLDFDTYDDLVKNQAIEFVFPNPTAFQELKDKYGVNEFLSVRRNFGEDNVLDRFGGVIVRSARNYTNIVTIADLKEHGRGMRLCAVNPNAFGGWHIQWLEMLRGGIDVDEYFTKEFLGNHNDPLRGLLTGHCDLGIARSETIERLIAAGDFNDTDVFTIGDRGAEYSFPQYLTTPLYPEWPLASLSHVPRELEQLVAIPLLTMDKDQAEAVIGDHAGFTFPFSYEPVRQLFLALDHYKDGKCDPGYNREQVFPRQCLPCPAGQYSEDGLSGCLVCPVGFVNNGTGNSDCSFCPAGLTTLSTGSIPGQCVTPAAAVDDKASIWDDPGTYVNIFVGALALVAVLGMTLYAKKKSGSLLVALEVLASGIMPTVLAFCMELSDLASDTAVALTVLAIGDLGGFPTSLKTVYVACVAAHMVPSVFNLINRGHTLRLKASQIETKRAAKVEVIDFDQNVQPLQPPHSAGAELSPESECSPMNGSPNPVVITGTMAPDVETATLGLRDLVQHEHRQLIRGLREDRLKTTSMPPFIIGMVLEDLVMSIVNIIALVSGVGSAAFRAHPLFPLLALATVSSLLNFGFKFGVLGRWLILERRQTRVSIARVKAIHALLPDLDDSAESAQKAVGLLTRRFSSAGENFITSLSSTMSRLSSFVRTPKAREQVEVVESYPSVTTEAAGVIEGSDIDDHLTSSPPAAAVRSNGSAHSPAHATSLTGKPVETIQLPPA